MMAFFKFDNSYLRELANCCVPCLPDSPPSPNLVYFNPSLAAELGLDIAHLNHQTLAALLSGQKPLPGAEPVAQAYAGHQFGQFNPELGDGRAVLLGEVIQPNGQRFDLAFKGSGRTLFARGGDGKAVLGPMLREVLISEAMAALGVPTTRSLAVTTTGENVWRGEMLPGAVLTRTASSHLRIGTFQWAAQSQPASLKQLADYSMKRHYPQSTTYLDFFQQVCERQAVLVAKWMSLGFIHGVMNTDNLSIAGETIDYGPCAFMEAYEPSTVFSSIDRHGRYAYHNQPAIAEWNLARLAESLLSLLDADTDRAIAQATEVLQGFMPSYKAHWQRFMATKLGMVHWPAADPTLIDDWLALLNSQSVDFTLGFYHLSDACQLDNRSLHRLFTNTQPLNAWLKRWRHFLQPESSPAKNLRQHNPLVIPRNHLVEEALTAAHQGNLQPFHHLLAEVQQPFRVDCTQSQFTQPASLDFTKHYQTFCGT